MRWKPISVLLLVVAAALSASSAARAEPSQSCSRFTDVPATRTDCEALRLLVERGILAGRPDGTFGPDTVLTRAEFAKVVVLALGQRPQPGSRLPYNDTATHWAAGMGYLQTIYAMGLMRGADDGSFRPDEPLSRAQFLKVLVAATGSEAGTQSPYTDLPATAWYTHYIITAFTFKYVGSQATFPVWTGLQFTPDQHVTRAEAARGLANFIHTTE